MKKPKLSRKRCSPLPDIYTPIDKTSCPLRTVQLTVTIMRDGSARLDSQTEGQFNSSAKPHPVVRALDFISTIQ